jgi:hypothetical protein
VPVTVPESKQHDRSADHAVACGVWRRLAGRSGVGNGRRVEDLVPNAGHVDLYDKTDLIPFDKLDEFFTKNLT